MIEVKPVKAFQDNYIWLIIHKPSGHTAIVDPGDAAPVIATIKQEKLQPAVILITHHHGDHIGGVKALLDHYKLPVYGPKNEHIPGCRHALQEGDTVKLDDLGIEFKVLDIPGHTSGHIAYYGHGMAFVGDTLFMSGCGRLFEGTAKQMYASLNKLMGLADDTLIYCAHEYTTANLRFAQAVEPHNADIEQRIIECNQLRSSEIPTVPGSLAQEKRTNPFLRANEPEVIAAANQYQGKTLTGGVEVFAAIRKWKDNF